VALFGGDGGHWGGLEQIVNLFEEPASVCAQRHQRHVPVHQEADEDGDDLAHQALRAFGIRAALHPISQVADALDGVLQFCPVEWHREFELEHVALEQFRQLSDEELCNGVLVPLDRLFEQLEHLFFRHLSVPSES
jgi:hypothetical protein